MPPPILTLSGVVVSAGRMTKAVKVRSVRQAYNQFLQKHFQTHRDHFVADPTSSLRVGDVIRFQTGYRKSKNIGHIVTEIVAPYEVNIEERPPIDVEQSMREYREKRERKLERRAARREGRAPPVAAKVEEEEGKRRGNAVRRDPRRRRVMGRTGTDMVSDKAVRNEEETERLQAELDEKGVSEGDMAKRLEDIRVV